MKNFGIATVSFLLLPFSILAQEKAAKKSFLKNGIYFQWGYNTEWFTKSDFHFVGAVNGVAHDFRLFDVTATDQPDMDAVIKKPIEISVPQYNYRIGFYLNEAHTKAIEINFDHTKYVINTNQKVRIQGTIGNKTIDTDTLVGKNDFLHFEHTNGANFYHFNYVSQHFIQRKNPNDRPLFSFLWKAGAGFMIPKTDVTMFGKRLDNEFNIAGYCISGETAVRYYPWKKIFFEGAAKGGFVNYTNALTVDGGKAQHSFGYFELVGTVGFDINF